MRLILLLLFSVLFLSFRTIESPRLSDSTSPLSQFSSEWDKPEYRLCNTASGVNYLTEDEKQVIYILNLARMDPVLFMNTVVKKYPAYIDEPQLEKSEYYRSLLGFLKHKKARPLLYPDQKLFRSAQCHAASSGEVGYVGHTRKSRTCSKVKSFSGECCQYGYSDPLSIIMDLLIDEGVPSLGHRLILFDPFTQLGVSIQPHKKYQWNTVLDLD